MVFFNIYFMITTINEFKKYINEQFDGKSQEVSLGNVDGFDLIYQTSSKMMGGNGISGTIRTKPQNYYVATIDDSGKISFDGLEANTRNINKDQVIKAYHLKNESNINESDSTERREKDIWWNKNYDLLIDYVSNYDYEDWEAYFGDDENAIMAQVESTAKHNAQALLGMHDLDELNEMLGLDIKVPTIEEMYNTFTQINKDSVENSIDDEIVPFSDIEYYTDEINIMYLDEEFYTLAKKYATQMAEYAKTQSSNNTNSSMFKESVNLTSGEITFESQVDDYEHDGDTQNELIKWKTLGAKTKNIPGNEDNDPAIEVTINLSYDIALSLIEKCRNSMIKANRTGDYSTAIYGWDLNEIFYEFDKKFGSNYKETFKSKIKELNDLNN